MPAASRTRRNLPPRLPHALTLTLTLAAALLAATPFTRPRAAETTAPGSLPGPIASSHLHNLHQLSPRVFSGSSPENDAAFAELKRLGITTVVSVDGARPDVEAARRHGLRYVHLPVGYDLIPPERGNQLAQAIQTANGPVYVHCHHGKHRGPAAAAILCQAAESWTPELATNWLRQAGTSPDYPGLYRSVTSFKVPDAPTLASLPPLPEVTPTSPLVEAMVSLDSRFDALATAQAAGWRTATNTPDNTPLHQATLLWESFRELRRHPDSLSRPDDYRNALADSEQAADRLRSALRRSPPDTRLADAATAEIRRACTACHRTHRN